MKADNQTGAGKVPEQGGKRESRHILVVDDDRLVLAALVEGLRDAGYRVTGAASGEDALGIAERDIPHLALLDVRMPGMSGIELGRDLRQRYGVPFLYLSAYGDKGIVEQCAKEGALGYLVKPLDIQQIVPSIETALERGSEFRKLRESESQLSAALAGGRETSMAVGVLMMRDGLSRKQAFEVLRSNARSQRRPVEAVAKDLLDSAEKLYTINKLNGQSERRKRSDG